MTNSLPPLVEFINFCYGVYEEEVETWEFHTWWHGELWDSWRLFHLTKEYHLEKWDKSIWGCGDFYHQKRWLDQETRVLSPFWCKSLSTQELLRFGKLLQQIKLYKLCCSFATWSFGQTYNFSTAINCKKRECVYLFGRGNEHVFIPSLERYEERSSFPAV